MRSAFFLATSRTTNHLQLRSIKLESLQNTDDFPILNSGYTGNLIGSGRKSSLQLPYQLDSLSRRKVIYTGNPKNRMTKI